LVAIVPIHTARPSFGVEINKVDSGMPANPLTNCINFLDNRELRMEPIVSTAKASFWASSRRIDTFNVYYIAFSIPIVNVYLRDGDVRTWIQVVALANIEGSLCECIVTVKIDAS